MTKHQQAPHAWEGDLDDGKHNRRKAEVPSNKSPKSKLGNHEKGARVQTESPQEKRDRRLRERQEREAIETERKERERDFQRKRHTPISRYKPRKPPAGYKDPHDVCRQNVVPLKVKEDKRRQMKSLMNCIAFEPSTSVSQERERGRSVPRTEDMDNSLSSDTTSDITDVTPRSSSSGCSSMSKQSVTPERTDQEVKRTSAAKRSKSEGRCPRRNEEKKKAGSPEPDVNGNLGSANDAELEEMRYLQEAFEDFDLDEEASDFATSIISERAKSDDGQNINQNEVSLKCDDGNAGKKWGTDKKLGLSEERRAKCGRKNMTFTNEQIREIERVNLILLKKIMAHRKPKGTTVVPPPQHRKTSAAVNRAKAEKIAEKENLVLLRKLQMVKGTTTSITRKPTASPTAC